METISLAIHGGAGATKSRDYAKEIAHMRGLVEAGRDRLRRGSPSIEVVIETIHQLEASALYVAGRGASPNLQGGYELDASVMDGATTQAGAVAALEGFQSPILVAEAVMRATPHVLLAGAGAASFARSQGLEEVVSAESWFVPAGRSESNHAPALSHGTVGCVARDTQGRLAAGTSTGGVFNKLVGRVGDTPIIGAGVWADQTLAVSCTGQGEYFLLTAAAAQVGWRMRLAGESLQVATRTVLNEIAALGGEGGMIAVAADGTIAMPFVSEGMKRAALHPDGRIEAAAF